MKMDERKQKVLQAIILDYIATADPVGSRTIAKKYNLGVSPATVRNEMADLEEMGFLEQPHTSAGRIPSQLGYRYYVDCLMKKEPLKTEMKKYVRNNLVDRIRETEDLIQYTSKILSQMTSYTSMVLTPFYGNNVLRHIKLLPFEEGKAVMIIVLDNGHVEHRLMEVPEYLGEDEFATISAILDENLRGLTLEQWRPSLVQSIHKELKHNSELLQDLLSHIEHSLEGEQEQKVFMGGALNILDQPEFKQLERVRPILELLEHEEIIKDVLVPVSQEGVTVRIGTENKIEGMKDCSLITATYRVEGRVIGTLGVLGPTRMEYSRVISVVEFLTSALTEALKKM
ncbi:MAG: heat-inducible transcriptional repressor HrcA [Peptococcia bacterium]